MLINVLCYDDTLGAILSLIIIEEWTGQGFMIWDESRVVEGVK